MRIAALLVSAFVGGLVAGCATISEPTVLAKFQSNTMVAMVGEDNPTDQFMMTIFEQTNAIIIRDGRGGDLNGMLRTLAYLDENPNKTIVIDGPCYSACTLLLSRPQNVVFTENADFYFHSAALYYESTNTYVLSAPGNAKMFALFSEDVQDWILDNQAFASRRFVEMTNKEARFFYPKMFVKYSGIPLMVEGGDIEIQ